MVLRPLKNVSEIGGRYAKEDGRGGFKNQRQFALLITLKRI